MIKLGIQAQGTCTGKINPCYMALETRGARNFMSCYNQKDLTPGTLKVYRLLSGRARKVRGNGVHALEEATQKQPCRHRAQKPQSGRCLRYTRARLLASLRACAGGAGSLGDSSSNTRAGKYYCLPPAAFPLLPSTQTPVETSSVPNSPPSLPAGHPTPCSPVDMPLLAGPLLQVSFHKQTRAYLVNMAFPAPAVSANQVSALKQGFYRAGPGPFPQYTHALAHTPCSTPELSCRHAPYNMPSVRAHSKHATSLAVYKHSRWACTTPKGLLPRGQRKITTHSSPATGSSGLGADIWYEIYYEIQV